MRLRSFNMRGVFIPHCCLFGRIIVTLHKLIINAGGARRKLLIYWVIVILQLLKPSNKRIDLSLIEFNIFFLILMIIPLQLQRRAEPKAGNPALRALL